MAREGIHRRLLHRRDQGRGFISGDIAAAESTKSRILFALALITALDSPFVFFSSGSRRTYDRFSSGSRRTYDRATRVLCESGTLQL
jgi:hypothetical protein